MMTSLSKPSAGLCSLTARAFYGRRTARRERRAGEDRLSHGSGRAETSPRVTRRRKSQPPTRRASVAARAGGSLPRGRPGAVAATRAGDRDGAAAACAGNADLPVLLHSGCYAVDAWLCIRLSQQNSNCARHFRTLVAEAAADAAAALRGSGAAASRAVPPLPRAPPRAHGKRPVNSELAQQIVDCG